MVGLLDFLRRWEHKDELKWREIRFAVADGGNINLQGTSEASESFLLMRGIQALRTPSRGRAQSW